MLPWNRFNTKNNVQHSKVNNKHDALRCIPVRSHMAYVNQFLPLPNSMHSHSVYCTEFYKIRSEYREKNGEGKAGGRAGDGRNMITCH
jgi:hypothetical protein